MTVKGVNDGKIGDNAKEGTMDRKRRRAKLYGGGSKMSNGREIFVMKRLLIKKGQAARGCHRQGNENIKNMRYLILL